MDWSILSGDLLCRSLSMFPVQMRGGSSISIASSPDQELVNFKYRKSQIDPYYSEVFYSAWSFLNSFDVDRPPPWNLTWYSKMELAWKPSGKSQAKGRWKFLNFKTKNNIGVCFCILKMFLKIFYFIFLL
jgi:hypothetical protein